MLLCPFTKISLSISDSSRNLVYSAYLHFVIVTFSSGDKKEGIPNDAYFLEEKAELEKAKARFYRQRVSFEKVRERSVH